MKEVPEGDNPSPHAGSPNARELADKARMVTRPTVQAAVTMKEFNAHFGELELGDLIHLLSEQTYATKTGSLERPEAMLTAQAHALDTIFNSLSRRAAQHLGKDNANVDSYLRLALRAQAQCRTTLEALASMKQPKSVAFVSQANIAQGHQQVNNHYRAGPTPQESENQQQTQNSQNKLMEEDHGAWMDPGTSCTTGSADQAVEAVGAIDRTEEP